MKTTLTLNVLAAIPILVVATTTLAGTQDSFLGCDAPVFDYGTRSNTEEVEHAFTLTNRGTVPVIITQVRSGCGCTRAELDRNTIPPGETATLSSRLTLRGYSGPKTSSIYLHSNDPDHPVFLCQYRGTAVSEMDISPSSVHFDVTPASTNQAAVVTILNRTSLPLRPLALQSPFDACAVSVGTNEAGRQYTLTVRCSATAATESVQGAITLLTDHPRYSKIEIPISVTRVRELNAYPAELVLREVASGSPLESRYVVIQSQNNRPFTIRSIEVLPPVLPVGIQSLKPFWVRLKVGPARPVPSLSGTVIRVHTDIPDQPTVDIPVKVTGP